MKASSQLRTVIEKQWRSYRISYAPGQKIFLRPHQQRLPFISQRNKISLLKTTLDKAISIGGSNNAGDWGGAPSHRRPMGGSVRGQSLRRCGDFRPFCFHKYAFLGTFWSTFLLKTCF